MRILITGHDGYLGPVFARHAQVAQPEWELHGLDAGFFHHCHNTEDMNRLFAGIKWVDVRDANPSHFEGVEAIVHLAALSNDPIGKEFENVTLQINAEATLNIAKLARDAGVQRFIFASSCSMYGAGSDKPRKEDDELNPLTAYAQAKVAAEKGLAELASDDFQVTCLRFATACGTSPKIRLDLVLNDFVVTAMHKGRIEVLSDGTPWRPLVHTEDISRAIEWALVRDGDPFLPINIGSPKWTWQIGQLAKDVADILGGVEVDINTDAAPDARSYRVDFSLFEQLAPDHQPCKDFEIAVKELQEHARLLDFGDESFRNTNFMRLNALRELRHKGVLTEDLRWAKFVESREG